MSAHNKENGVNSDRAQQSLAVLAAAGLIAASGTTANAEVIGSTAPPLSTLLAASTAESSGQDVFFNFLTGNASNTLFAGYQYRLNTTAGSANIAGNGTENQYSTFICGTNQYQLGEVIDGEDIFAEGLESMTDPIDLGPPAGTVLPEWQPGESGFLGFRFGTSGNVNFGWADIAIANDYTVTLNDFAYETVPNAPIAAGSFVTVVPEANPLELLLLGATGLGAYRLLRRKDEPRAVTA